MTCRQESSACECVSCDSISLFLMSLVRNSQPLMRCHVQSKSRVKQEEEIELYVENILLQLPASDKRKTLCVLQGGMARLDSKVSKLDQSILVFKRRDKDLSSKAFVSLFRHR